MKHGKKYIESAKLVRQIRSFTIPMRLFRYVLCRPQRQSSTKPLKFISRLGVDSRHADQQVRGAVVLPHGTGKTVRVLVFAKGDKAQRSTGGGRGFRRR